MPSTGDISQTYSGPAGPKEPLRNPLLKHVAVIMDGNGRWAEERNLPRREGHTRGYKNVSKIVRCFSDLSIQYLTLFGFSTENWGRPEKEVTSIMELVEFAKSDIAELHQNNVRILHVGRSNRFSQAVNYAIKQAVRITKDNTGMTLSVAFDYGGRYDIMQAVKSVVADGLRPDQITEEAFEERLFTRGLPDVDMLIRTGSEFRISNFLLWQAAYAELYFSDLLWPDFDEKEIHKSLDFYQTRRRRFGRVI